MDKKLLFVTNILKLNSLFLANKNSDGLRSKFISAFVLFLFFQMSGFAQTKTYYTRVSGNWNDKSTWKDAGSNPVQTFPIAGDNVFLETGKTVTVTTNAACASITFLAPNSDASPLKVNAVLNVSGNIVVNSNLNAIRANTISGTGTLSCASVQIGSGTGAFYNYPTNTLTSTVANFNVSGNFTISSYAFGSYTDNVSFNLQSGTLDIDGQIKTVTPAGTTSTFSMATGAQSRTLLLGNASPFNISATGNNTINLTVTSTTVNYDGAAQAIYATTYQDLTLSGSGNKTLAAAATVSNNLTLSGTSVLAPSAANLISDGAKVIFNGGTYQTGGFNETLGTLTLTENSSIQLSGTSTTNFANSAGITWTAGKTLTIKGWTASSKIFVGTASTALTADQISQIKFQLGTEIGPAKILATGELVPDFCSFAGSSQQGTTTALCYDNNASATINNVGVNKYVGFSVIEGLTYKFETVSGNLGFIKKLVLFNSTNTGTPLVSKDADDAAANVNLPWTATFTGVVYVLFNATNCQASTNTTAVKATFTGGSNVATQTTSGTDSWIGHVYDFPATAAVPPTDKVVFTNYLGYFAQNNSAVPDGFSFTNSFGGDNNCYSFTAGGTTQTVRTETFAVRYIMQTTATSYPAGCYFVKVRGDDGVRLYIDDVLVFNSWVQQASTEYKDVLVHLTGTSKLVFDYYEKGGGNISEFSITKVSEQIMLSKNTIITSNSPRCSDLTTLLDGSTVATKGNNTIDPVKYQWQTSSTSNGTFTNISSATSEDYTVPATSPTVATTIYYRRIVKASTATGCEFASAAVSVTTNPNLPASVTIASNFTGTICQGTTVLFTATPINGGTTPTYQWKLNGTNVGTNSTYSNATLINTNAVTVVMTADPLLCTSGSPATSNTISITSTPLKTWIGNISTDWNTAGNWSPAGIPTLSDCVTIPETTNKPIISGAHPTNSASSLTINDKASLLVQSDLTLKVEGKLTVDNNGTNTGNLTFENNASLVQGTATVTNSNSGKIIYKRTSKPMKNFDYTYWSSPVVGQTATDLSPYTFPDKYHAWVSNNWVLHNGLMEPGHGYIIRVPKPGIAVPDWTSDTYDQEVNFVGIPNNGTIYGETVVAGQDYLIGNPYPSALNANLFLDDNPSLEGTIYFWTHNTEIRSNGSGQYIYESNDFAAYNRLGGVGTAATTKGNKSVPSGNIAAGQSFFATATTNGSITFTNAMRVVGENTQFFKPTAAIKKERLWLNLSNKEGAFKQILIGYVTDATNEYDAKFDGITFDGNDFCDFYSINENSNFVIQGRALPFADSDEIPLGYSSVIAGEFTIAIDQADGDLTNQDVFIEDKLINTIFNLRKDAYTFTTAKGTFKDRFVLKYTNKALGVDDFQKDKRQITVAVKNKVIKINSAASTIEKVLIYDILGKIIYSKDKINSSVFEIANLRSSDQMLLVKLQLENGVTQTTKIMF